jgi:hypothetical protein
MKTFKTKESYKIFKRRFFIVSMIVILIITITTFLTKLPTSYVGKYVFYESPSVYKTISLMWNNKYSRTTTTDGNTVITTSGNWRRLQSTFDANYSFVSLTYYDENNSKKYFTFQYQTYPTVLVEVIGGTINENSIVYTKI